ncbi:alpha/beta hydrolase [Kribbella sp. NPDC050124]|uniref:alpha/beta hydrolase n=1 Tax=Kribbella sp. NPDC050124 TaxID=3364114 RepID=UPI003792E0CA
MQSFMIRFFDWCKCSPAQWQRLVAKANRTPIPAPAAGTTYDGNDLRTLGLQLARRGPEAYPKLAEAIKQALAGDASGFMPARPNPPYPYTPTPGVVECTDWPRPANQRELHRQVRRMEAAAPYTGASGTIAYAMLSCVGWPVPVQNEPAALPRGLPPLLMVGNWSEYDSASRVIDQVPGSGSVYHDGPGHTLYMVNACARAKIDAYFADRVVPPRGTRC